MWYFFGFQCVKLPAHIAEVVAGENKVYVDTGIFPTAERRHMADRVQGNEAEREGKNNFDAHTISAIIKSADMVQNIS